MTIYTLYVKTHRKTGLKYLGQTTKNPQKYRGSGVRWKSHIKKYGYDVNTEILKECCTKEELKEWGLHYSNLWDVVKSPFWANCTVEEGTGGLTVDPESRKGQNNPMYGKNIPCSNERRLSILKSKNINNYTRYKMAIEMLLNGMSTSEVGKSLNIKKAQICTIKRGIHGIFEAFPDLCVYKEKLRLLDNTCGVILNKERYELIITLISKGYTNTQIIHLERKMYHRRIPGNPEKTLDSIRNGSHRVFKLFPELKKLLTSNILQF